MTDMIPEPAATDPDAAADAIRDALALVRAALDSDAEAVAAVADNMTSPRTSACILAGSIARGMRDTGMGAEVLAQFQEGIGL